MATSKKIFLDSKGLLEPDNKKSFDNGVYRRRESKRFRINRKE